GQASVQAGTGARSTTKKSAVGRPAPRSSSLVRCLLRARHMVWYGQPVNGTSSHSSTPPTKASVSVRSASPSKRLKTTSGRGPPQPLDQGRRVARHAEPADPVAGPGQGLLDLFGGEQDLVLGLGVGVVGGEDRLVVQDQDVGGRIGT